VTVLGTGGGALANMMPSTLGAGTSFYFTVVPASLIGPYSLDFVPKRCLFVVLCFGRALVRAPNRISPANWASRCGQCHVNPTSAVYERLRDICSADRIAAQHLDSPLDNWSGSLGQYLRASVLAIRFLADAGRRTPAPSTNSRILIRSLWVGKRIVLPALALRASYLRFHCAPLGASQPGSVSSCMCGLPGHDLLSQPPDVTCPRGCASDQTAFILRHRNQHDDAVSGGWNSMGVAGTLDSVALPHCTAGGAVNAMERAAHN